MPQKAPAFRRPSCGAQTVAVEAIVGAIRPHPAGERQMTARRIAFPELLQRPPETEMRVVVRLISLDHGRELRGGPPVPAASKIGPAQRLTDRGLVGLEALCLFERHGSLREVVVLKQREPALKELVGVVRRGIGRQLVLGHRSFTGLTSRAAPCISCTWSRIRAAISFLPRRVISSSLSGVIMVTSFSSESKPMPSRDTSLTTIAPSFFRSS